MKQHEELKDEEKQYYARQLQLSTFSIADQQELKEASVLIVGAGGLAMSVIAYLAGVGVGKLCIVDGDKVEISNLHRQVIFQYQDIGAFKSVKAAGWIERLNPYISVEGHPIFLSVDNAEYFISQHDLVIDCTDRIPVRYTINDFCVLEQKPFIYGGVYENEGQLALLNYHEGPSYRCLYPRGDAVTTIPSCDVNGTFGVISGMIGMLQAQIAIQVLLERSYVPSGILLLYDGIEMEIRKIHIPRVESNFDTHRIKTRLSNFCKSPDIKNDHLLTIEWKELSNFSSDAQFVDVRTLKEYLQFNIGGIHIPLNHLHENIYLLEHNRQVICFCQHGIRSEKAVRILKNKGFAFAAHVKKGLSALPPDMRKISL